MLQLWMLSSHARCRPASVSKPLQWQAEHADCIPCRVSEHTHTASSAFAKLAVVDNHAAASLRSLVHSGMVVLCLQDILPKATLNGAHAPAVAPDVEQLLAAMQEMRAALLQERSMRRQNERAIIKRDAIIRDCDGQVCHVLSFIYSSHDE